MLKFIQGPPTYIKYTYNLYIRNIKIYLLVQYSQLGSKKFPKNVEKLSKSGNLPLGEKLLIGDYWVSPQFNLIFLAEVKFK